jgi:hypothetical protein
VKRIVLAIAACAGLLLVYASGAGATTRAPMCGVEINCISFTNHVVGGALGVYFHIEVRRGTADGSVRVGGDYADGEGTTATFVWGGYTRFLVESTSNTQPAADMSQYDTTIACTLAGGALVAETFVDGRTLELNVPQANGTAIRCEVTNTFLGDGGAPAPKPQGPDRFIYCSAAGDTDSNGNPIAPGTSLNLLLGQPLIDAHYTGATPGFWIPGLGVTCSLTGQQAALAAASTKKVNHVGGSGDYNQPEFYTLVG